MGALRRDVHLIEAYAIRCHALRIGAHLDLFSAAADHNHLRDAGNRQQARTQLPVGERAEVHWGSRTRLGGKSNQQNLTHDGRDRPHVDLGTGGKLGLRERDSLLHELARSIDILAPIEFDIDNRQTDAEGCAHALDTRSTIEGGFEGQ